MILRPRNLSGMEFITRIEFDYTKCDQTELPEFEKIVEGLIIHSLKNNIQIKLVHLKGVIEIDGEKVIRNVMNEL